MKINFFQKNGFIDPKAIGAGVYQFKIGLINDKDENYLSLYIGESYSMISRCSNHIFEVFHKDSTYFGLDKKYIENSKLELIVEVYKSVQIPEGISCSERGVILRKQEIKAIELEKPLSQLLTSDNLKKNRVEVVGAALDKLLKNFN